MPGPYSFTLYKGATGFDYDNQHYGPGAIYGPVDACAMKSFINAYQQANPDAGVNEESATFAQLEQDCPATPNDAVPQNDAGSPPTEDNPADTGGDSGDNQGAPSPQVDGGIGQVSGSGNERPNPAPGDEDTRPPAGQEDPTHGGERSQTQTNAGDPVDIFTGACYLQETDLVVPNTLLPLSFIRVYRSGAPALAPLGWNWDHNFNLYLRELDDGNIALWRNLHEDVFQFDGAAFQPPRAVFERLTPVPGLAQVYEIAGEGGTVMHFERPPGWVDGERIPITQIKDRHGNRLRFTYHPDDKLAEVRDDDDRFFQFEYDDCRLLVSVTDHSGRVCTYAHDEQTMHLEHVLSPPTTDFPKGIERRYYYWEEPFDYPELRHNIVRIEDGQGNVYLENTYDDDPASWSFARVVEQLYGDFLYQFCYTQLQWVPADPVYVDVPALRVEVMNPDFGLETYTLNYRGDLLDRRFRLNKDYSYRVVSLQYRYDEQGNLARTTRPDGSEEIRDYDFANLDPRMRGKILKRELTSASGFPAPSRIVWQGRYEPVFQQLIEETNEADVKTKYRYDFDLTPGDPNNSGKLKEIIHPNATLPDGVVQASTTRFEHNNKGQVTATLLPDGVRNELVYGAAGGEASRLIRQVFDAAGLAITQRVSYNAFGFDSTTTDGNGFSTQSIVNALGLIEKRILPPVNGAVAEFRFHYDSDRKVIGFERPRGEFADPTLAGTHIADVFERDVLGYPTKYAFSSNTAESRIYKVASDYRGFPMETIYPDGSRVRKTYDERGLLLREAKIGTDGTKSSASYAYDRTGNMIAMTDSRGLITRFDYDGFARMAKRRLPNGTEISYVWGKGDVLQSQSTTGPDGFGGNRLLAARTSAYDEKFRKVSETVLSFADNPAAAVNVTTLFFHDTRDRVVRTVDARGAIRVSDYDGLGRLRAETDPLANQERYFYDANSNLTRRESDHREPNGSVTTISKTFEYDERNRRTAIREPDGAAITFEHDDRDLEVRQTDLLGFVKETRFNSLAEKLAEVFDLNGLAITHEWTLDNMGRATTYVDPTGQQSRYFFDSIGRPARMELPNGFVSDKLLNALGQMVRETLSSGTVFEYTYDAAGRLETVTNSATPAALTAVPAHHFAYDGLDRLVTADIAGAQMMRKYDSLSRLISENSSGQEIRIQFDDLAGTLDKSWPDGRTELHTLNLNGVVTRIEETTNGTLGAGVPLIASFVPSGPESPGTAAYNGNIALVNRYDERKRLTDLIVTGSGGVDQTAKYRYDKANRKQVETFVGQNSINSYFDFDHKYRVTSARRGFAAAIAAASTQAQHDAAINVAKAASAGAAEAESFTYNAADARMKYTLTGAPVRNYAYLPGHRVQNDGANNYSYHADGTVRDDGALSYEADCLGRIVRIKAGPNLICSVEYDALGRPRVVTERGKPARSFNYFGNAIDQENDNGALARQITRRSTGGPIAYHVPGSTHYTLVDGRSNLIGIADPQGALLESYRYKAFGAPVISTPAGIVLPASAFGIEPVFGGLRYLASAGLYLSPRRIMHPTHGIFLSPDPKGYVNSASLYVYAAQNPIDLIDPNGEFAFLAILAVMAIGAVVAGGLNAIRQGIQIAEGSRSEFSWGELGLSIGIGAIAAPLLVVAPELVIPLAAYGVVGGISEISQGHYGTGAFDIVTSLAPFGFKGVRGATFGRGTAIGEVRGLGPMDSLSVRTGRFTAIENNLRNFAPAPNGRQIGLGFARSATPGDPEGHVGVIFDNQEGGFSLVEKNATRAADRSLIADFNSTDTLPEYYFPERLGTQRPFEYDSIRIPRSLVDNAQQYARNRIAMTPDEVFDRQCANCSHFSADTLGQAGFNGLGNGRASGLYGDFGNFVKGTNAAYASPFWTRLLTTPPSGKK